MKKNDTRFQLRLSLKEKEKLNAAACVCPGRQEQKGVCLFVRKPIKSENIGRNRAVTWKLFRMTQKAGRGMAEPKGESTMKGTGIVRRIDDLGRIIIPKKIRRTLRLWKGVFPESAGCSAKTTPIPAMKRDGRGAVWGKRAGMGIEDLSEIG